METKDIIAQLDNYQVKLFVRERTQTGSVVVPAAPGVLAENLLLIRGLLIQLVEKVAAAEREYRTSKASRLDTLLKGGMKRSPAIDQLDFEEDLIGMKIETERVRNYMKYVDGLCTSIQSVLKVQSSSDRNQY